MRPVPLRCPVHAVEVSVGSHETEDGTTGRQCLGTRIARTDPDLSWKMLEKITGELLEMMNDHTMPQIRHDTAGIVRNQESIEIVKYGQRHRRGTRH